MRPFAKEILEGEAVRAFYEQRNMRAVPGKARSLYTSTYKDHRTLTDIHSTEVPSSLPRAAAQRLGTPERTDCTDARLRWNS
jgi:hypothetical protein